MRKIKLFENFTKDSKIVICDSSCLSEIRNKYTNCSGFDSNSSLISRLKSLISNGEKDIKVILDDRKNSISDRISFIKEFVGKGSYEINLMSEIN